MEEFQGVTSRILSVCQSRARTANFVTPPEWLSENCQGAGFKVSLETIDFDFANVQHAYDNSEPAQIKAKLTNSSEIHIYIGRGPDEVFCQLRRNQRQIVHARSEVGDGIFGSTKVMPPVGSLLPREKLIAKERLNKFLDGYLAYRHFRNQLWERAPDYRLFKDLMESTWQNLQIQHFENDHGERGNEFSLLIREGRFSSEISWHGHGLQAWAQTIWFLSRVNRSASIVLDEPDVYLHADLQRKLIKLIESLNFRQSMIATHSSEIISDVPFQNVVIIQKRERVSKPAAIASDIQESLRGMGSIHSIQLSKISDRGVVLFVEGEDRIFLSDVAYKMGVRVFDSFSEVAIHEIKGKGNWQQALGAATALNQISGSEIESCLLLDRDYMLDDERESYHAKAAGSGLNLHIWERKEIENYFLVPDAIARFVNANCAPESSNISADDVNKIINAIELDLREDLILSFAEKIRLASSNKIDLKSAHNKAKALIDARLSSGARIADMASGKAMFSRISDAFQKSHSVSFNALSICKECKDSDVPLELIDFVSALCKRLRR